MSSANAVFIPTLRLCVHGTIPVSQNPKEIDYPDLIGSRDICITLTGRLRQGQQYADRGSGCRKEQLSVFVNNLYFNCGQLVLFRSSGAPGSNSMLHSLIHIDTDHRKDRVIREHAFTGFNGNGNAVGRLCPLKGHRFHLSGNNFHRISQVDCRIHGGADNAGFIRRLEHGGHGARLVRSDAVEADRLILFGLFIAQRDFDAAFAKWLKDCAVFIGNLHRECSGGDGFLFIRVIRACRGHHRLIDCGFRHAQLRILGEDACIRLDLHRNAVHGLGPGKGLTDADGVFDLDGLDHRAVTDLHFRGIGSVRLRRIHTRVVFSFAAAGVLDDALLQCRRPFPAAGLFHFRLRASAFGRVDGEGVPGAGAVGAALGLAPVGDGVGVFCIINVPDVFMDLGAAQHAVCRVAGQQAEVADQPPVYVRSIGNARRAVGIDKGIALGVGDPHDLAAALKDEAFG